MKLNYFNFDVKKSLMKSKNLSFIVLALLTLAGCSSFTETQPPAPVAKTVKPKKTLPQKTTSQKPMSPAAKKAPTSVPGTATYAIEEPKNNFKVEPNLPTFRAEPLLAPAETPASPVTVSPTAPAVPEVIPAYVTEEARIPAGTSPAVLALLTEADRSRGTGDLDAAVIVMERALRIDSRNPTLTYKLAQLRIKQNKPQMAEELAGKAALLAGGDLDLKRKSWLLIAEARRMQQNPQGAKEAKAKAESFFGR